MSPLVMKQWNEINGHPERFVDRLLGNPGEAKKFVDEIVAMQQREIAMNVLGADSLGLRPYGTYSVPRARQLGRAA